MSEPVGNSPRALPGNSHKEREAQSRPNPEPQEEIKKVVEGKVVLQRPPWYRRVGRNMLAEDAGSITEYVMVSLVYPNLKNLLRDVVVGFVDRALWGPGIHPGASGNRSMVPGSSFKTRYDQMPTAGGEPRRQLSQYARENHDFNEVILTSRDEALSVIDGLMQRVNVYGAATVSNLYSLLGTTGSHADLNWGWTDLSNANVREYRGGWLLDLPRPRPLR
jgi:hypothetical protein